MATQPTLASLLGSKDSRKQVSLDLGQQALTPQVRRAGQYNVFAQPTAQENTSTRLANALSGVSPVLKNYAALTYSQGQAEAAAILPGNAEAQLKKMEPGTWLNMARQRGLREGLIKKHFNHTMLPEFKAQASEYSENFEKYPTLEKAVEAFNAYRDERWAQYVEEMPEGIGGSLESKVLWSTITDNVRNGVIESYNRNIDKFNLTNLADEDDQVWNNGTLPTEDGIDWAGQIAASNKRMDDLGSKAGLPRQDITEKSRIQMIGRADALQNKGKNQDALELIKALRAYKVNGQNIYADSATDVSLSRIEKAANAAISSEAGRSASDVAQERELLSSRFENIIINANTGDVNAFEDPAFEGLVANFTNAPFEDVKAEIEQHMATGALQGDAIQKTLTRLSVVDSSDNQRETWTVVSNSSRGALDRHYAVNERRTKLEIGQQNSFFSNYQTALEQGITSKGPVAYAQGLAKQLNPEQLKEAQSIYNAAANYLSVQAAEKDNDEAFLDNLIAKGGSTSTAIARPYQNNVDQELKPLYKRLGELRSKDELNAEEQKELSEIPGQLKTIRTNALGNFTEYIERFNEARNQSQAQMDRAIEKAGELPKKKQIRVRGKNIKLPTVESRRKSATVTFPALGTGAPLGGISEAARDWTEEEYTKDRQLLLQNQSDPDAKKMLTYSLATYPISLARPTNEDEEKRTIEMVDMLSAADFDIYEDGVYIFDTLGEAQEFLFEAANAYGDFKAGQLKRTPYNNALLKFAEMNGIVDVEALKNAVTINRTKYSQKPD